MRRAWGGLVLVVLAACSGAPGAGASAPPRPVPDVAAARMGPDDVEVFTNGEVTTRALLAGIGRAQRSIDVEIYEFGRADLIAGVLAALRRGVVVRMVGDPTISVTRSTGRRLAAAGAVVTYFPVGPRQIDHVKLMLVDGRDAFFGGVNWGVHSYLNHDFELHVRGPAVARLERVFAIDLGRSGRLVDVPPDIPPEGSEPALLTSYPADDIGRAVVAALRAARHSIEVEMFVMTDVDTIAALVDAAHRGVAVQVLFDPGQDLNQVAMVKLRAAGARCRFYPTSGELLHAKVAVIDGDLLVVGSANWTASGFRHNHELDAVLRQPVLATAVAARMDADWRLPG
jgi:phosphatidylserine/phosphatidylglycerophosphate/cardiolipin synthase-like enzyme